MKDEARGFPRRLGRALGALALLAGVAAGQNKPKVTAQLGSGVARVGEAVSLVVAVENVSQARIVSVPRVEGLEVGAPQGPNSQRSTKFEDGRMVQRSTIYWTMSLRSREEGEYEIPPFEIEADGQRCTTRVLTLRVVRDVSGEELGFLELTPTPARVVEGQPFSLEIRFGWDKQTRVSLADLLLPWWGELSGAVELADRELTQSAQRVEGVSVNGRIPVVVEEVQPRTVDGREFRVFRLVKSFVPGRPGTLDFPTSFLEFGQLVQPRTMFANPTKKTFFVQAPPLALEVVALPTAGQPLDFSGAVGTLAVRASADTRDVVVGDSIKLDVTWTGTGNLEFFQPPDLSALDAFAGFRMYGRTEEKSFEQRKVTYDLAPLNAEVTEIPSVPLSVFDPTQEKYEVVATEPIPIRVRPLAGRTTLATEEAPRFESDMRDIDTRALAGPGETRSRAPSDGLLVVLSFALPASWLALRAWVRRRGQPDAPLQRRRARARKELARRLRRASTPQERLGALTAFLAARSGEPDEAWVGRDPSRWLEQRGDGAAVGEDAARLAAILARLEEAIWGGVSASVSPLSDSDILLAADGWQRALRAGRAA